MTEEMYGDEPQPKPKARRKAKALKEAPKKKVEVEGYLLRVQAMGSIMDIVSPIPRDQFVEEMVDTINEKGADPMWSGWYHLKKVDEKIVSVRLRSIDVVEEL
jgi:hypothetical protein